MKKTILFSLILFMISCIPVYALDNKLYLKEDDNKLYYDSGQLNSKAFLNIMDMLPGKEYSSELTIMNGTSKDYTLFFKVKPREDNEKSKNFIDNIHMSLYLNDILIYDGKASGNSNEIGNIDLQNTIELKKFESKESSVLKVVVKLNDEYNILNDDAAYIDWSFYAQGEDLEEQKVEIISSAKKEKKNIIIKIIDSIVDFVKKHYIPIAVALIIIGVLLFILFLLAKREKYILIITIPAIKLKRKVWKKLSRKNKYRKNVVLLDDSDLPDVNGGNIQLAARIGLDDKAFFKDIDKLTEYDDIIIEYKDEQYIYRLINSYKTEGHVDINNIIRDKKMNALTLAGCGRNQEDTKFILLAYRIVDDKE